jgi:hypothetical protein
MSTVNKDREADMFKGLCWIGQRASDIRMGPLFCFLGVDLNRISECVPRRFCLTAVLRGLRG